MQTVSCYHNPRGHGIRAGVRDWERRHHDSRGGRYDRSAHWLCKSFSEPWKTSISWCQFPQLRGCGMFHCTQNDGACIRSPLQKRQSIIIVKVGWKASKFEWFWPQTTLCHPRLLFLAMGASFQARQIFRSEREVHNAVPVKLAIRVKSWNPTASAFLMCFASLCTFTELESECGCCGSSWIP